MIDPNAAPTTEWTSLRLAPEDHEALARNAAELVTSPYTDLAEFRHAATETWGALSAGVRAGVVSLARGDSASPELHLTGLPTPLGLGATPTESGRCVRTPNFLSEFVTMVVCAGLGAPISYRDQRNGSVFHDIFPTRSNAAAVSSQSSSTPLGFHTEMFFHPQPPDFLMLHCLRADPSGVASTSVAALADISAALSTEDRQVLSTPHYAMDLHRLHGSYVRDSRPIAASDPRPVFAICPDGAGSGRFRFEPELTTALTSEALHAMHRAEQAAHDIARSGRLEPGGLLLVDNRRAAHSRSEFPARFDGSDRWLRRVMVGASDGACPVVHRHHDLELARAWSSIAPLVSGPADSMPVGVSA